MQERKDQSDKSQEERECSGKINFMLPKPKPPKKTKIQEMKEKYEELCA